MHIYRIFGLLGLASATDVLIPLYIWPGAGAPTNWKPLLDTIAAYPSVFFTVAVNPDSGPGTSDGPDTDFAPSVGALNSYPNVRVIGYVHTLYGDSDPAEVQANITKWSRWNDYAATDGNADTTIAGIWFDEVEYRNDGKIAYMNDLGNFAKSKLQTADGPTPYVVYNPGTIEPAGYFTDSVDLVVQAEKAFSDYSPDTTIAGFADGTIPISAVVLHDAAAPDDTITSYVQQAAQQGLGAIYITQDPSYNAIYPNVLNDVAAGLA